MFFTSGRILACFIFLWTRADAWSNCWLWGRFGFLHWYIRLESRTVSIFLNFCTFLIGPAVLSGVRTVWETLWRHFGFPKFLHFPNIDKYSLAHETIVRWGNPPSRGRKIKRVYVQSYNPGVLRRGFLRLFVALAIKEFEQRRPKLTSRKRRRINSQTHMYLFMKESWVVLRLVWFREKPLT